MAKRLLRLFGGLGIAAGLAVLAFGFESGRRDATTIIFIILPIAGGCLMAGAIVLGLADALHLLEKIEQNSRESRSVGRVRPPQG